MHQFDCTIRLGEGSQVAEVLGSGSDRWLRAERSRLSTKWFALALGSALLTSSVVGTAQVTPARQAKKDAALSAAAAAAKPATPVTPDPVTSAQPPVLPAPMAPARAPIIAWDGKSLTIDAENSTLSDVLLGIRARTGASIEMPGSTSGERVSLHAGPAPVREVLASLLYGTNFNYMIQASEDDESGLGKVILTSRDGGDVAADDSTAGEVRADRNVRLMPGYAAPGKRDFEVAHARAMEAAASGADNSADSASQDAQPSVADSDAASTQAPPADSQPVASNTEATDSSSSQPDTMLTAAGQTMSAAAAGITSSGSASTGNDTSSISGMEQTLQKLYQQRQQIQAQQNKPQPPAQTPAP